MPGDGEVSGQALEQYTGSRAPAGRHSHRNGRIASHCVRRLDNLAAMSSPDSLPRLGIVAIGLGAALMLAFMFVSWYGTYVFVDVSAVPFGPIATHDAWHPFSPIDLIVVAAAVILLAAVPLAWMSVRPGMRRTVGWVALFLGLACTVLVLVRIVSPPELVSPRARGVDTRPVQRLGPGGFLTLASAMVTMLGGALTLRRSRRRHDASVSPS